MGIINQIFQKVKIEGLDKHALLWKMQFHREMIMFHNDNLRLTKYILRKKLNKEKDFKIKTY